MPKYGYLVVEGPHDVEAMYRLLRPSGLKRVQMIADLDPFFVPIVPRSFPPDGDLQKRVPVPLFLQSGTHSVAIHSAVGDTRLIQTVEENAALLDSAKLTGIGIVLDSDSAQASRDRYEALRDGIRAKGYGFPDLAGEVSAGSPRHGAFVLPDNASAGTLEDILLDCAQHVYPILLASATSHVDSASQDTSLVNEDRQQLLRPAGRQKAIVGSIASILRPGRAIQVSIQDNRWLRDTALQTPACSRGPRVFDESVRVTLNTGPKFDEIARTPRQVSELNLPLTPSLLELLPWLKQWHNEVDPEFGMPMGDYFEGFIQEEAHKLGKTLAEIKAWEPPKKSAARRGRSSR